MHTLGLARKATLFIGLALIVALSASSSSAWWGGRHGGFGHGYYGHHGLGYYGPYYWGPDFAVVAPPIGGVVGYLPDGYMTFVINGVRYYYSNGYYFRTCPSGYVIVSEPEGSVASAPEASQEAKTQASVTQPATQAAPTAGTTAKPGTEATAGGVAKNASAVPSALTKTSDDGAITVNIPNSNGGFTAVKLTKFKDGYKGPQGEFYPNHPTVDELKALYGGAQ
jgi:hypothetical protein